MQRTFLVAGILFSLLFGTDVMSAAYFTVGGWQVTSCVIHLLLAQEFIPSLGRRPYLITVLVIIIAAVPLLLIPSTATVVFFFCLLFVSPFLAFWHLVICKTEINTLKHRSLVHLK